MPEWVIDADVSDAVYPLYSVLLRYGQLSGTRGRTVAGAESAHEPPGHGKALFLRLSTDEHAVIGEVAAKAGLTPSGYAAEQRSRRPAGLSRPGASPGVGR